MASSDRELEEQLLESGNKLVEPPSSVDELLSLLDRVESCLSKVEQSPAESMQTALAPSLKALVDDKLLGHSDVDVKVAVASCISEITRITAPEAPYDDDRMKEVFQVIVSSFENLSDNASRSYSKRTSILETVAKVRSCVVMLDLECDALIVEMFQHFLNSIRDHHPENVISSMETIMTLVLEESEDISVELLSPILASVKNDNGEVLPVARRLGERVLEGCVAKVKPYLVQAVKAMDGTLNDYSKVVAIICRDPDDDAEKTKVQASVENMADESETVKPSSDKEAQENEEVAKGATSEKVDPSSDRSPPSALSNGVAQTGEDDSLADSSSIKKQEDDHPVENTKDSDAAGNANQDSLNPVKVVSTEEEAALTTEKEEIASSPVKSTKPSDSPHAGSEKEQDGVPDPEGQTDDTPLPLEVPSAEAASTVEKDEGSDVKVSPPKMLESISANDGSVSPTANPPDETHSKKAEPCEKDSSDKEAAPSLEDISKKAADVTSDSEVKPGRHARKKMQAASSSEPNASPDADVPVKDIEATSDSEVKPGRHARKKVPAGSSSGTKASADADVPMKDSEATSDSEVKPGRHARKKVPAGSSGEIKASAEVDVPMKESEASSDSEENPLKQSAKKVGGGSKKNTRASSTKRDDKKKSARGKSVSEKDVKKTSGKDNSKDIIVSPKSPGKLIKNEDKMKETPKTDLKRKRTPGKEKEAAVKDFGESLVGSKVKVWWPDDRRYYDGTIVSFDSETKMHEVLYTDGDEETLNLKDERWEFIGHAPRSDEEEETARSSPEASTETPLKKKTKTKSDERSKQKKVEASPKKVGGGSSSKSKANTLKSRSGKSDGKSKDGQPAKPASKSEDVSGGKSKDQTPKSGSTKSTIISFKSPSKSKNNESQTPKGTKSKEESTTPTTKSKQAPTPKAGKSKSKLSTLKTASASKDKSSVGGGKSNVNGTGKAKSSSSKAKESENVKEGSSGSENLPEATTKGKSLNPAKEQGSDVKSGKKRRRGAKG